MSAALTLLLSAWWLLSLCCHVHADDIPPARSERFSLSSSHDANDNVQQAAGSFPLSRPQTFSFRSILAGAPDFLKSESPFVEPIVVADVESDSEDSHQPTNIQLVSADSSVTFLRARNSGNTSIAVKTDETSQEPVPRGAAVPLPGDATKSGNAGNVMVIPAHAGAPAVDAVPNPATEVQPTAENNPSAVPPLPAEAPVNDAPAPSITLETINAQRTAAEQLPDLAEDVRAQLAKYFQHAGESIIQKTENEKKIGELKAEKENGPTLIAEARALLNQPPPKSEPEFPLEATVAELDQLRLADDERAAEARRNLEAWDARAKTRAEKKPQMPALIETTRKQLEDEEKAKSAAAPEGELPVLGAARRLDQQAYVLLLQSQLELFRVELIRYEALNELFPLQRDVLTRVKNSIDKRVELWKTILADARRDESARQAHEAREKLQNAHPTLRDLAEDNSKLTLRRKEMQGFLQLKGRELTEANTTFSAVEQKFRNVNEKEKRAGLTTAIGLMLRSQRTHLPDGSVYRRQQRTAEQEIVRLQTEQMLLEDERSDLSDIEAQVEASLKLISAEDAAEGELRAMTIELLTDRRQYLDNLLADYDSCLQTLADTDVTCRRLETTISEFKSYIDERVLWIRSAKAVDAGILEKTLAASQTFVSHRQWEQLVKFMVLDARTYWPLYGLFLIAFCLIIGLGRRIRQLVTDLGDSAQKQMDSGIPLTLLATGLTIVMASAWPLFLWFAGWRLSHAELNLASALSGAFISCAGAWWLVDFFRKLCRKRGVAESFLAWPQSIVRSLHAGLQLYIAGGIPLSFIVVSASRVDDGTSADSIGRLAFVSLCLLLAVMLRRIVRPSGAVIGDLLRSNPNSMMYRLR